jgi:hypothetical protein
VCRAEVNALGNACVVVVDCADFELGLGLGLVLDVGRRGSEDVEKEGVCLSSVGGDGGDDDGDGVDRAFHGLGRSPSRLCTQLPKRNSVAVSRVNFDAKS